MDSNKRYIGLELSKTNNVICRNLINADFKKEMDDLTGKNGWIIAYIASHKDKEVFQRDIEEEFSIRRSTVSSIVQLMEKKGFVTRESVDHDARLKKLVLTPKALEIYAHMVEQYKISEEIMRRGISFDELEVFFGVLEKIRNNALKGESEC